MNMRMRIASGQTLLELLVAFMVIAVGLFAAVTLIFSNFNAVNRDADSVVAINLAREGVELAKQIRDSNWLAGDSFDKGLMKPGVPSDITGTPQWEGQFTPLNESPKFDWSADDFTDERTQVVVSKNTLLANIPTLPPPAADIKERTPFRRLLTFESICFNDAVPPGVYSIAPSGSCGIGVRKVGVRVKSHVQWKRKGAPRDVVIYEEFYDWK